MTDLEEEALVQKLLENQKILDNMWEPKDLGNGFELFYIEKEPGVLTPQIRKKEN